MIDLTGHEGDVRSRDASARLNATSLRRAGNIYMCDTELRWLSIEVLYELARGDLDK